jgi:hypothetical protein
VPTSEANYAGTFISTTEPRHSGKIPAAEALYAVTDWTLASASHPNLVSLYIHSDTEISAVGEEPGGRLPAEGLKETVLVAHSSSLPESSQLSLKVTDFGFRPEARRQVYPAFLVRDAVRARCFLGFQS